MTQISPLPGKVVVAAPTESSGSVSEISTNVSSAVSGANVRYRQGKHSSERWMQTHAMACSVLSVIVWPCLVKFKWRWWRHVINFICIYLHCNGFGPSLNLGVNSMLTWHDHQSNYKKLNNVKVKQRFRRRRGVGEFDTRKGATKDGIQLNCIWQYARGWFEDEMIWRWHART